MTHPQSAEPGGKFRFLDASMRRCAKWGIFFGYAISMFIINNDYPPRFHSDRVFALFIGGGILFGLVIGWLISRCRMRIGSATA